MVESLIMKINISSNLLLIGCRAAAHDYFYYWFTCQLFCWLILKKCKKCPSQFPRTESDVFKCLILFDRQLQTKRHSVYSHIRWRKAANPHIKEAGTCRCLGLLLDITQSIIKIVKVNSFSVNPQIDYSTNHFSSKRI